MLVSHDGVLSLQFPLHSNLRELQLRYTYETWAANGFNRAQTAKQLGISIRTLYTYIELMRSHPIIGKLPLPEKSETKLT